jgi:hypothetical protein
MISHDQVRRVLAVEPMTAVFIDRDGNFVKLLSVPEQPTPELVVELSHSYPDFALVPRPRGNYASADLEEWSRSTVEGFEVFESGKLPPGWRHL